MPSYLLSILVPKRMTGEGADGGDLGKPMPKAPRRVRLTIWSKVRL